MEYHVTSIRIKHV